MWRVLEIGEKIESGDERYWHKDMAWSIVTESCIGSPVVRTDGVVRRKISDNAHTHITKIADNMEQLIDEFPDEQHVHVHWVKLWVRQLRNA